MTLTATFVGFFALLCVVISGWAVFRIIQAEDLTRKPLWVIGSLFGFVGFGLDPSVPGHLFLYFGVQIPVVMAWSSTNGFWLKALFPIVALVALVKLEAPVASSQVPPGD